MPHVCVSLRLAHVAPPCCVAVAMERERVCAPPPHDAVQSPQALQPVTTQSIGQAWVLHSRVSDACAQATPPCCDAVVTERVRIWLPVPHVSEHEVQPLHAVWTQSTGHAASLQDCTSYTEGHT